MKFSKSRGPRGPHALDPDFVDALNDDESHNSSNPRQAERKTRQFCRQVQRALNLALSNDGELFVDDVEPAPDCGRLLVSIVVPPHRPIAAVLAELSVATPRLRAEVAASITRKRAPELFFVPVHAEGAGDE